MAFPLGNFAALRTMRVLRALKTVAVVPGMVSNSSDIDVEIVFHTKSRMYYVHAMPTGRQIKSCNSSQLYPML